MKLGLEAIQATRARHAVLPHWLVQMGAFGLFAVSAIDASIIPLPLPGSTDLLLLFLTAHRGNPFLLAGVAIAGSIVGGYFTWAAGKKGGESMLARVVPQRFLKRLTGFVHGHGVAAVVTAALLPPPIPLMPFLVASGALGVSRRAFLWSFSMARIVRYGLIAALGAIYGRQVVRTWTHYLRGWSTPILWTFVVLLAAGIAYGIWKYRRDQRSYASSESEAAA